MDTPWDWSTTPANNGSVGGADISEGCPPSGLNNAARNTLAQLAGLFLDLFGALTTTGSANAYALSTHSAPAALADGIELGFVANFSNSAAATLAVDSLGAKALRKVTSSGEAALAAGDVTSAGHYIVRYDASANSAAGAWILLNPTFSGAAYQPLDADLTAIAALTTTSFGRSVLAAANAAALATLAGVGTGDSPNFTGVTVGGVAVPTISSASTFTNKRVTARIGTTASSATPTPDADANDQYNVTALAAGATFGAPTGTPTDGQRLLIRIKDNGTARSLAWNAIYAAGDLSLPTTTVISKTLYCGFIYNAAAVKWQFVGQQGGF